MKFLGLEFTITKAVPPADVLPSMYDHNIQSTRIALFEVRLERESSEARELTLMKRLQRLEAEKANFVDAPRVQIVRF